jgi:hypothetical protein
MLRWPNWAIADIAPSANAMHTAAKSNNITPKREGRPVVATGFSPWTATAWRKIYRSYRKCLFA